MARRRHKVGKKGARHKVPRLHFFEASYQSGIPDDDGRYPILHREFKAHTARQARRKAERWAGRVGEGIVIHDIVRET